MLPFLKLKEGSFSGPVETAERKHDDEFDLLDAVAEDLLHAVEKRDKKLLRDVLESLCEYLMVYDEKQDKQMEESHD